MCTSDAARNGFCDNSQLGRFIFDLPSSKPLNETSFWSARVAFSSGGQNSSTESTVVDSGGFWDNPEGNPTPPPDVNGDYTSPWKRSAAASRRRDSPLVRRQSLNPSPSGILYYQNPIQYLVRKTGYYCVGKLHPSVLIISS